jgi:hypothetical protein
MRAALVCLTTLLVIAPAAFAQSGTAEIWGDVVAVNGNPIAEANVTARNIDTAVERTTHTGSGGRFGISSLPPGRYQVTALHAGFADRRQEDVVLLPGQRMQLEMELREALLPNTVALNLYPPIMETARTHVSSPIADTELHELAVVDQQYQRLAGLAPNVADDVNTGGISVTGLPSTQNRLVIDGVDQTSSITGERIGRQGMQALSFEISQASIDGMRVYISGAPAEVGRAAAGHVEIVTKSGSNALHGSAYEFFGDRTLNAKPTLQAAAGLDKPAHRNNQFGGLLGGAIRKERSFFLVSYERLLRRAGSPAALNFSVFDPVYRSATESFPDVLVNPARAQQQNLFLVRTDHTYGGHHVMLRYSDQRFDGQPIGAALLQPAIVSEATSRLSNRSAAASVTTAAGLAFANEMRTQYARHQDHEDALPWPQLWRRLAWQGASFVGQTGATLYGPHAFDTHRLQFGDAASWVSGAHALKIGADVLRDRDAIGFDRQSTSMIRTGPVLPLGLPFGAFTDDVDPRPVGIIPSTQYAAFVQDAWRATSALTLDLGIRYDRQDFGRVMPNNRGAWAPRAGFAYSPGGRGTTVRGSYGVFHGSTPALVPAMAQAFPQRGRLFRAVLIDPSFRQPRVQQASIGAEVEQYRAGSGGVQYVFARGERLPRAVDMNIRRQLVINPYRVVSFQSNADSIYHGISLNVRARVLNQLLYRAVYTIARSDETPQQPLGMVFGGDGDRRSLAQSELLNQRAPGNNDVRHRAEVAATWNTRPAMLNREGLAKLLLDDWTLTVVYTWHTGYPYTAFVAGDLNRDENWLNDVAPGTSWNQYRLPSQGSFDPRATRRFDIGGTRHLEVIWEAFNITNRPNYTAVDNTMYGLTCWAQCQPALVANPLFGRNTAQANGRMMQLAARLTF